MGANSARGLTAGLLGIVHTVTITATTATIVVIIVRFITRTARDSTRNGSVCSNDSRVPPSHVFLCEPCICAVERINEIVNRPQTVRLIGCLGLSLRLGWHLRLHLCLRLGRSLHSRG